jgi:hypothetical protein
MCPECGERKTKLKEERALRRYFVCNNAECRIYNKVFSEKTGLGYAVGFVPLVLSLIIGVEMGGGGGPDGNSA